MKKIMLLNLLIFAASLSVLAQKKPSQAVLDGFNQKFPGITDVDWSREKNSDWEAEFDAADGQETSARFSAGGIWLETEVEIPVESLPAIIREAVNKMLPGKKIKEAARILDASGQVSYEAEVGRKDLIFDSKGNLIR